MRVIMKVLDVDVRSIKNGTSQLANITLKSDGSDAISAVMFSKDIEDGKAKHLEQLTGQWIVTDLEVESREGELNFRFGYQAQIMPYNAFVQNEASKIKPAAPVQRQAS